MLNLTLPAEAGLITPQPGEVLMVTNADLREPANVTCWPTQKLFEERLETALETLGYRLRRAHPVNEQRGHGFISSQKEGSELFAGMIRMRRLLSCLPPGNTPITLLLRWYIIAALFCCSPILTVPGRASSACSVWQAASPAWSATTRGCGRKPSPTRRLFAA